MARFVLGMGARYQAAIVGRSPEREEMAGEVDRLLAWMSRVEKCEAELEKTTGNQADLVRARLERARDAERRAFVALTTAAYRGDPEALVALDALKDEIEEKTWSIPRPAA